jgi:putative ABC transport system permease protein
MRLTVLPEIHFVTDTLYDDAPKGSKQMLSILFAIGILIVVIAGINFTNFTTALLPVRIKNINTQRVLGAQQIMIRLSIIAEAIFFSLLSYLVALLLVSLFKSSPLAALVNVDLSLSAHFMIVGGTAFVALFAGFFSGLYPSYYMTSFEPALVLKGSFGLSPKGKKIRNTLIGIQFIASFALIIGASFMYLQNYFMQNAPLGYDREELIVVDVSMNEAFTNELKSYPGIKDITFSERLISSSDYYMGWGRPYKDGSINFQILPVHYTFLKVMGIEITEGRDFREEDANTLNGAFIFNETAKKKYDLELGVMISSSRGDAEIIGFMPDIKFASFRMAVVPMAFFVWGTDNWGSLPQCYYIKLNAGADKRTAMKHIHSAIKESFPKWQPFIKVRFFDEVLQQLYEKEISLSSLISLFSLLAIFISIVGVFGLVVFDSECRRKEIGIRKISGATTSEIIVMFNKVYFRILAICFVIAVPIAWYAVHRWLQNFAYKTPMYWWVFLIAFIVVAIITAGTVTFQNWRVANENPVGAIKGE